MSRSFVGAGTLQPNRDIGPGSDSNAKRSKSISPSNISDIWNVSTDEDQSTQAWRAVAQPRRASFATSSVTQAAEAVRVRESGLSPFPPSSVAVGSHLSRSVSHGTDLDIRLPSSNSGLSGIGSVGLAVPGQARARASSVPLPYLASVDEEYDTMQGNGEGNKTGSPSGQSKWSGGLPWGKGQAIWQQKETATAIDRSGSSGSDDAEGPDVRDPTLSLPARQQRSLSLSLGTFRPDEDDVVTGRVGAELLNDLGSRSMSAIRATQSKGTDAIYGYGRNRNRSQSSSAVFGLDDAYDAGEESQWADMRSSGPTSSLRPPSSSQPSLISHRRALSLTQHPDESAWDKDYPPTTVPLAPGDDDAPRGARLQRRFSHSPQLYFDHAAMPNRPGGDEEENHAMEPSGRRRHSVATPLLYGDHGQDSLADSFSSMRVDDGGMMRGNAGQSYAAFDPTTGQYVMQPMYPEDINDYFENQEPRARAWVEGTRNLQMQQYAQRWPIYVVEFKAGRKDFFFVPENSGFTPKKGDFVVVEADRGKDLGKVVHDSIRSQQELQTYQQLHAANFLDNHPGKEVHAKRIYRLAQPAELSMLSAKMADEEKAMNICQGKVRSKRLPMEVVDAEYQWDRRKLTFYFVADRRIDFRELVRDLFKIYKTRIWLCSCGGQVGSGSREGGVDDGIGSSPSRSSRDFSRDYSGAARDYSPSTDYGSTGGMISPASGSTAMSPPMSTLPGMPPYPMVPPPFRPMALGPAPMGYGAMQPPPMPYGMLGPRYPPVDTRR